VTVTLRFYAELNDFLPAGFRFKDVVHACSGRRSVKDAIEAHGVPHTEVDLVLVNGEPVDFRAMLADGDRVAVYPVFELFDIATVTRVRPEPLRDTRFILDVHLGRLARYLRLSGFDTIYRLDVEDADLARLSRDEHRILLTRDHGLLKRRAVTHGYFVRSTEPAGQLAEVLRRFDLRRLIRPFSRCMACNGDLEGVDKLEVAASVPERSRALFDTFLRCRSCLRVYWPGSHYARLKRLVEDAVAGAGADA
jgi:uncharacterized protein